MNPSPPRGPRPILEALAWLLALAAFFFATYWCANWVTGLRAGVPEIAFAWERHVPFLPWTIVPYWSTDLFYAAALLLCATRAELRTLVERLLSVQLICIAGFLLFPLKFTWPHPAVSGVFGQMFDALLSFDRQFNQSPSLHVALTAVLWAAFGRSTRGPLLWLIRAWLALAALSTLTTYQHHFIDLPTGLAAGLLAIAWVPDPASPDFAQRDPFRLPLAAGFAAIGAAFATPAIVWRGPWLLLLWPAAAASIVAAAYWRGRPDVFRKAQGRIPWWLRIYIAPYLGCAFASSRLNSLRQAHSHEIAEGVWLGRYPSRADRAAFASFVDLTAEFPFDPRGLPYRSIPQLDLLAPDSNRLSIAVDAIGGLRDSRPTLVFCALGYSRSAAAVAAWVLSTSLADCVPAAMDYVRARRACIVLRPGYVDALHRFAGRKPLP